MDEIEDMMKMYDCKGTHMSKHSNNIMILLYADDIAEGDDATSRLQQIIDVLHESCKLGTGSKFAYNKGDGM